MGLEKELFGVFGAEVLIDEPMKNHTTYKLGGKVKYFIKANYLVSIKRVVEILENNNIKYIFLGNGSNLLVSDKGFNGAVIKTNYSNIIFEKDIVTASSGVNLSTLSNFCINHSLSGMEALSMIPATVGGAISLNAGAFSKNISDYLIEVSYLYKGKVYYLTKDECAFSYRDSIFKNANKFIISGKFAFNKGNTKDIKEETEYFKSIRKEIQPIGNSCGSVFMNTKKYSAGELIEKVNLKGFNIGGAKVSEIHANFIIADKNCSSNDVYNLIRYIKKKVFEKFDILLNEEVEYLGEF